MKKRDESTPEEWAAHLQYMREWRLKNLEKERARLREYSAKPEVRAKRIAYQNRPDVAAKRYVRNRSQSAKQYAKARYEKIYAEKSNRLRRVSEQRLRRTGVTDEMLVTLLTIQGNKCAVCYRQFGEAKVRLCADHCHDTNTPRGLLCQFCNSIEGMLKRLSLSPAQFAERLAAYLTAPPALFVK